MKNKATELLAPAGSFEAFQAALHAGADAVYAGGNLFGARAYADNLSQEQWKEAIDYAHLHRKKLYMTVNTLLKEEEIENDLYEYIYPLYIHGLDAVIVQDLGVFEFVKRNFPGLEIHASTQMTSAGSGSVKFLTGKGAARVVLSRELGLKEIEEIYTETGAELECFVHGALCYCYSGQCLLSSLIGGRSGNRGRCAQACRLPYQVLEDGKEVNKGNPYVLSPKDMCTLDLIPDLVEAGIYSFKVEGRMKRTEYTAGVIRIYRKYLDLYLNKGREGYQVQKEDVTELMDLYNRGGFSAGYYPQKNGRNMLSMKRPNHYGVRAGKLGGLQKKKIVLVPEVEIHPGDILEIYSRKKNKTFEFTVGNGSIEKGRVFLNVPDEKWFQSGIEVVRTHNKYLLEDIRNNTIKNKLKEKINGKLILYPLSSAILEVECGEVRLRSEGGMVQEARERPMEKDRILSQMKKTGNTPFEFEQLDIEMGGQIFIPMQVLNELRRQALEELEAKIKEGFRREKPPVPEKAELVPACEWENEEEYQPEFHVSAEKFYQLQAVCKNKYVTAVYLELTEVCSQKGMGNQKEQVQLVKKAGKKCYINLPWIFRNETRKILEKCVDVLFGLNADGFVVRNLEEYVFLKEHGYTKGIILDYNVYNFNKEGKRFWQEEDILFHTLPLELNKQELGTLGCKNDELVVYGYIPVMITAQCIHGSISSCDKTEKDVFLKDRKGKQFRVKNNCTYCYNLIYNSAPLHLSDQWDELKKLKPGSIRFIFTEEAPGEAEKILKEYEKVFLEEKSPGSRAGDFTRGHFTRGIE